MSRPAFFEVKTHVSVDELKKMINSKEKEIRVLKRLYFIKYLYDGDTVENASKMMCITKATGYSWLKRWNAGGYLNLKPKFAGGSPSKLSSEQKTKLKEILEKRDDWVTKEVCSLIEIKFGVKYSQKQVFRILRSFGMKYAKPYPRDYRRPDNAEDILKKN